MRRHSTSLNAALDAYGAAVKPLAASSAGKAGNWPVYALATGSALAMATSANAGIIYSGPLDVQLTVKPVSQLALEPNASGVRSSHSTGFFPLQTGLQSIGKGLPDLGGLHLYLNDFVSSTRSRAASISLGGDGKGTQKGLWLTSGTGSDQIKQLISGAKISHAAGAFTATTARLAKVNSDGGGISRTGWPAGTGFAGFEVESHGVTDYGWIELKWSGDSNGYPDEVDILGAAFATNATFIDAGDTGQSGVPEPGTFELALLAAGSAGVMAWRKRKKLAA